MKKIISCILILAIVFTLAQPAFAAQPQEFDPQYTNVQRAYVSLQISDSGSATITVRVLGKTTLKNTNVSTRLERKVGNSWVLVDDWQYSTTTPSFTKNYEVDLSSTGQYRAVANFTLTASTVEYITDTCSATY